MSGGIELRYHAVPRDQSDDASGRTLIDVVLHAHRDLGQPVRIEASLPRIDGRRSGNESGNEEKKEEAG